jgi:type I restriction enzyme S subunit
MNKFLNINKVVKSVSETHKFDKPYLHFLNTSDVEAGKIINTNYLPIKELKGQAKKTIKKHDILFSEIRPKNKRYAYVDIDDTEDYVVSTKLMVLRNINIEVDNRYFYYFLTNESMLNTLQDRAENRIGSFPQITFDLLSEYKIRVPNITTQQKIASVLSVLDSKIELNICINAELEEMVKTIYDYWFVQFDFPDANGKPYKTSGGKMFWNEQLKREIPEGWEAGNLLHLGEIIGGSTPPREVNEYFTSKGTAWITPKDLSLNIGNKFITRGELDVSDLGIKAASLKIMPKGTILLSSRAPVGYLAISREQVTTNQGFKSFVPNKGFPTEFVYYTVKNMIPTIENNAVGSTFKEVSATTLKTIPICLPNKIVIEKYSELISDVFKRQDIVEVENQQLSELRDWLLPMLMNGQVRVGEAEESITELGMVAEPLEKYETK